MNQSLQNSQLSAWRKPYRGMLRLWLFDLGSVSFIDRSNTSLSKARAHTGGDHRSRYVIDTAISLYWFCCLRCHPQTTASHCGQFAVCMGLFMAQ